MTSSTDQDKALQKKIDSWREPFDAFSKEVVGKATDVLDGSSCQKQECEYQILLMRLALFNICAQVRLEMLSRMRYSIIGWRVVARSMVRL